MSTAFIVLAALLVVGLACEALARRRDRARWPHPGKQSDVGGHGLHVRTYGEVDLPVVFEADEGAWSTHWGKLPEDLGAVQPTVAYDRAGLGWSEPGPPPRDAETLARERHQRLARLHPGKPAVLVGHGTGAHGLRAYAHRYPFETAGLVLVDPRHDGLVDRLRREQIPTAAPSAFALRAHGLLASLGVLRTTLTGLTPQAMAALKALGAWPVVRRRLATALDTRAALALVERGEAVAGIVYATDARASQSVIIAGQFPQALSSSIAYPVARLAAKDNPVVNAAYRFITGPEAGRIFRHYGFGLQ